MKTCESCDFSVQFDRSLSRKSLGNLGCGFLNKLLEIDRIVPQVEPDHWCYYYLNKEEAYDGNQESIQHLIHPFID